MKLLCCLLFCLVSFLPLCYAQNSDSSVIRIDAIPASGTLLDMGWKFHTGDDPKYAQPDYDDTKWQPINPSLDIHKLPQVRQGIVWLRLHLFLDSSFRRKQLSVHIEQSGASEIYLNGKLIYAFGVLDSIQAKVKAYDPLGRPVAFPVENGGRQILAIRYAVQRGINYKNIFGSNNYVENITIRNTEDANRHQRRFLLVEFGNSSFLIGAFFILAILHFSFFLFYRSKIANLYFALFALLTIGGFIMSIAAANINWVGDKFRFFYSGACLMNTAVLFMLASIYQHLEQRKGIWFLIFLATGIAFIVAIALPGYWGWDISVSYGTYVVNLNIARISFLAVKRKQRGAWIMAVGSVCFVVGWIVFIRWGVPGSLDALTMISFDTAFLSIPAATSVYLGLDFAFTNRLLHRKLIEVDDLSEKAIAQEREKQQILSSQKETLEQQVSERTTELKQSIEHLRSTQQQLIQSEKMASLGELTAGIAHEIQNPLNFVNNFSEVNKELIDEAQQANESGNPNEVKQVLSTLKDNEEKINHHGKRADAIVKGMLQHSRTSSATKEPTDVNRLADEYLRLAYQGFRARDKSFNASFKTEFENELNKVNIVPQEIGRVILNLINNAFYAVNERAKQSVPGYEPTVIMGTRKLQDHIEISVKDNGNGIPGSIKEKIFQPFFTTKPTGQGTGLGLSLAYDIVKAYGGEIRVEAKEGEGSEFIIQIPA